MNIYSTVYAYNIYVHRIMYPKRNTVAEQQNSAMLPYDRQKSSQTFLLRRSFPPCTVTTFHQTLFLLENFLKSTIVRDGLRFHGRIIEVPHKDLYDSIIHCCSYSPTQQASTKTINKPGIEHTKSAFFLVISKFECSGRTRHH